MHKRVSFELVFKALIIRCLIGKMFHSKDTRRAFKLFKPTHFPHFRDWLLVALFMKSTSRIKYYYRLLIPLSKGY